MLERVANRSALLPFDLLKVLRYHRLCLALTLERLFAALGHSSDQSWFRWDSRLILVKGSISRPIIHNVVHVDTTFVARLMIALHASLR